MTALKKFGPPVVACGVAAMLAVGATLTSDSGNQLAQAQTVDVLSTDSARAGTASPLPSGADYSGVGVLDPAQSRIIGEIDGTRIFTSPGIDGRTCLVAARDIGSLAVTCTIFDSSRPLGNMIPLTFKQGARMVTIGVVRTDVKKVIVGSVTRDVINGLVALNFDALDVTAKETRVTLLSQDGGNLGSARLGDVTG
jgi:hypothetical protein